MRSSRRASASQHLGGQLRLHKTLSQTNNTVKTKRERNSIAVLNYAAAWRLGGSVSL